MATGWHAGQPSDVMEMVSAGQPYSEEYRVYCLPVCVRSRPREGMACFTAGG